MVMPIKAGSFIVQYGGDLISARVGNALEKSRPSCFRIFWP